MATLPVLMGDAASPRPSAAPAVSADGDPRPVRHVTSRFPPGPRSIWKGVSDTLWNDWHWQQRERVTTLAQLEEVVRVTEGERRAARETEAEFHMGITPYYAALMDP
jgi:lysine 2,3-aminomutase